MREVEYKPKACSKKDGLFEGSVKIKLPTTVQRYEYLSEVGFEVNEKGEVDNAVSSKNLRSISKMIALSRPHYVSVNIKYKDGSGELKSYDDMLDDPNCDETLIEIASLIMNGFRPSKK